MNLLYDTAARVGELTSLTLQDICLSEPGHVRLTGIATQPHRRLGHARPVTVTFVAGVRHCGLG